MNESGQSGRAPVMPSRRALVGMWVVATVVAGSVLAVVFGVMFTQPVPSSDAFYEYNAARLEHLAERTRAGAIGVVMLGDSRLRYATESDPEMSLRLTNAAGREIEVVRLVNNWAVFEDFERLVPLVTEAGPSLVVMQTELLAKDRADEAELLLRREYLLWQLFGSGVWDPGGLDQAALQNEMRCEALNDETVEQRRERVFRWVSFDPAGANAAKVRDFVEDLETRGIQLTYLTVPITSDGKAGLPGFDPGPDQSGLRPDFVVPDDAFCDIVHMDPAGRDTYTGWLVTSLAETLRI